MSNTCEVCGSEEEDRGVPQAISNIYLEDQLSEKQVYSLSSALVQAELLIYRFNFIVWIDTSLQ